MKQSWIVGIIIIYVVLQGLTMVVQVDATGDANIWNNLNKLWYINYTQMIGSSVSAIWAPAVSVIAAFTALGSAIVMYYPAIFQGTYVWFWWCICLPISVGFIISIVTIIRGVHTS